MRRSWPAGMMTLGFAFAAGARPTMFVAEAVGTSAFPTNSQRDRFFFDGCVDCSGPWRTTSSPSIGVVEGTDYTVGALDDNDFETCWAVSGGVGAWFGPSPRTGRVARVDGFAIVNGGASGEQ